MTDSMSKADRSALMSRIRSKNTGPELIVRSCVHRLGYRFRLHSSELPGSPDLVLRRLRTVVFVHGCFWHRHEGCKYCSTPKTRSKFWNAKFKANRARDARAAATLSLDGWRVLLVWECETNDSVKLSARLKRLLAKPNTAVRSKHKRIA
ncbi:MAG: DNA mismatch endonuclease Vsr [Phycisphaerales bacterium]|nr:DNA mismatch endonuclease Vsr [Phycisphaerales bacterium]